MLNLLKRLHTEDEGATATEYIVIVVIVALGLITAWQTFGKSVHDKLTSQAGEIDRLGPSFTGAE